MRIIAAAFLAFALSSCAASPAPSAPDADQALIGAVNGAWRSSSDRARDQHRHPEAALSFWGLEPGMTIVEINPGAGSWWTKILAPYARMTNGRYVAGYVDLGAPNASEAAEAARNTRAAFLAEYADASIYGDVEAVDFGQVSGLALPDASADFILVARAYHNWARTEGVTGRYMREFARVLRSGGVLAVEQHRAPSGADVAATAPNGYVPESYVIESAERAGLRFAARSELNANPRDDRDHPFGVWTLPPTRRSAPQGQPANPNFDHAPYDAVGESDRMTLRFVKP